MFGEGLPEAPDGVDDSGDRHGRADGEQEQIAPGAFITDAVRSLVEAGVVLAGAVGEGEQGDGESGVDHRLESGLRLLPQFLLGRKVFEVEDRVTGLPDREGHTRREGSPEQQRPGRLPGELLHRPADIGLALATHGKPDRDESDQQVQDAADCKPGTGHQLQRAGIGDLFRRVRGVFSSLLMVDPSTASVVLPGRVPPGSCL